MNKIYPNRKSARMIASDFRKATGKEIDPAFVHWLAAKKGFQKHPYGKEVYYASNLRSLVDANYYTLYPVFLKEKEQKKLEREKSKEVDYNPNEFTEPDRKDYAWESKTNRHIMEAVDKTFKPTTEWMAKKYQEMNQWLFGGELGECNFKIFTSGRGSQGGVLGWFKITGRGVTVNKRTRIMSYRISDGFSLRGGSVTRENFYSVCKPQIELNGNYSGTENAFLATLVHEMCHYYTYMNGCAPKQGHGSEFKRIGMIVSQRSNGMFTIQRLASAEQMSEMELNDEMKAKRAKRLANKKASVSAVLVLDSYGTVALTITSAQNLISTIKSREEKNGNDVFISNSPDVIDFLFDKGYKSNMRLSRNSRTGRLSWRYWNLAGKPWLNELKQLFGIQSLSAGRQQPQEPEPVTKKPRRIFTVKTSNGVFECDADCPPAELFKKINERFPRFDADTIIRLMGNINNYRIEENRMSTKSIIREVIEELMNNEANSDDSIEITPDMNLGKFSPLELA